MKKEKEEVIVSPSFDSASVSERECFRFEGYRISCDRNQYILQKITDRFDKDGREIFGDATFFRTLADLLEDMRDARLKKALVKSGDLETAIKNLLEADAIFSKLLSGLKQIEDSEALWKRIGKK